MLKRSKDRKVTNSATPSAGVRVANTFGLPSGKAFSCPGETSVCGAVCYAGKLERIYKGVKDALLANYEALKGQTLVGMCLLLSKMIEDFVLESKKVDAPLQFRIHWDGDFFSLTYVRAWITVIREFGHVQFWVYTRDHRAALLLHRANLPNLSLYFSADAENIGKAHYLRRNHGIRLAVLGDTFAHAQELNGSRKAARCPEQTGQIDLITSEGGACVRCGLCPFGKADILFSISKR